MMTSTQTPIPPLKTDFYCPITNLIDKANHIIEMVPKNKKQDLDKYNIHLSEQLSKLYPEVEDGSSGEYLVKKTIKK